MCSLMPCFTDWAQHNERIELIEPLAMEKASLHPVIGARVSSINEAKDKLKPDAMKLNEAKDKLV